LENLEPGSYDKIKGTAPTTGGNTSAVSSK